MTYSETKFKNYLKKLFTDPHTYIKKIADKKQTGNNGNTGMPDYLVISEAKTLWFEVKTTKNKTTMPLNIISESQYIEFTKIMNAGGRVYLAVYVDKELYVVDFKQVQLERYLTSNPSIPTSKLNEWRIKW